MMHSRAPVAQTVALALALLGTGADAQVILAKLEPDCPLAAMHGGIYNPAAQPSMISPLTAKPLTQCEDPNTWANAVSVRTLAVGSPDFKSYFPTTPSLPVGVQNVYAIGDLLCWCKPTPPTFYGRRSTPEFSEQVAISLVGTKLEIKFWSSESSPHWVWATDNPNLSCTPNEHDPEWYPVPDPCEPTSYQLPPTAGDPLEFNPDSGYKPLGDDTGVGNTIVDGEDILLSHYGAGPVCTVSGLKRIISTPVEIDPATGNVQTVIPEEWLPFATTTDAGDTEFDDRNLPKPAWNHRTYAIDFASGVVTHTLANPSLADPATADIVAGTLTLCAGGAPSASGCDLVYGIKYAGSSVFLELQYADQSDSFLGLQIEIDPATGAALRTGGIEATTAPHVTNALKSFAASIENTVPYSIDASTLSTQQKEVWSIKHSQMFGDDKATAAVQAQEQVPELQEGYTDLDPLPHYYVACSNQNHLNVWLMAAVYGDIDTHSGARSPLTLCPGTEFEMECEALDVVPYGRSDNYALLCHKEHQQDSFKEDAYKKAMLWYNHLLQLWNDEQKMYEKCPEKARLKKPTLPDIEKFKFTRKFKEAWVSFRGSTETSDWVSNGNVRATQLRDPPGSATGTSLGYVHAGFYNEFEIFYQRWRSGILVQQKLEDYLCTGTDPSCLDRVTFMGHSRGGSVASIAAVVWNAQNPGKEARILTAGAPASRRSTSKVDPTWINSINYINTRRACGVVRGNHKDMVPGVTSVAYTDINTSHKHLPVTRLCWYKEKNTNCRQVGNRRICTKKIKWNEYQYEFWSVHFPYPDFTFALHNLLRYTHWVDWANTGRKDGSTIDY